MPISAAAVAGDAFWLEPRWLKVRSLKLADRPRHRFVHFTDVHYKGNRAFLEKVVRAINAASPEFVCFTGDIIEEAEYLPEALEILGGIKAPLYGVPGNHDFWSHADFGPIRQAFAATGGAWLENQEAPAAQGNVRIHGVTRLPGDQAIPRPGAVNILLIHYPLWVENFFDRKFEVALAGHTHGGQVRLPFYGPLIIPFDSGQYDLGLFRTPAGPFYVSSGVGWFFTPVRFNCRPEIVMVEV